ncbi:unnamed protein product, partial [Candidula unifasciata]
KIYTFSWGLRTGTISSMMNTRLVRYSNGLSTGTTAQTNKLEILIMMSDEASVMQIWTFFWLRFLS